MKLFSPFIHFQKIDPMANGLAEEIAEERAEPEAIQLSDDVDGQTLTNEWDEIVHQTHDENS